MKYSFFDKQKLHAKENYNYFFMKMVFKIILTSFKISTILIFRQIVNNYIINIFTIIFIIFLIYNICENIIKYNKILKDIKKTLNINDLYIEIDLRGNLLKKVLNYGK